MEKCKTCYNNYEGVRVLYDLGKDKSGKPLCAIPFEKSAAAQCHLNRGVIQL